MTRSPFLTLFLHSFSSPISNYIDLVIHELPGASARRCFILGLVPRFSYFLNQKLKQTSDEIRCSFVHDSPIICSTSASISRGAIYFKKIDFSFKITFSKNYMMKFKNWPNNKRLLIKSRFFQLNFKISIIFINLWLCIRLTRTSVLRDSLNDDKISKEQFCKGALSTFLIFLLILCAITFVLHYSMGFI